MPDERLQKNVFYRELQERRRSQGGQMKRYRHPQSLSDGLESWEQTVED